MKVISPEDATLDRTVRKLPIDRLIPGGLVTLFIAFSAIFVVAVFLLVDRHQDDIGQKNLERAARIMSGNISDFRAYYSNEIIANLKESNVVVSHRFREIEGAVPLPATMSIELGEYLDRKGSDVRFRMFSDKPFPWRQDRVLDTFQQDALRTIKSDPTQPVTSIDEIKGTKFLRFVSAVTMGESCVGCHNARDDSPFRAWKVGDVRGVQEILISISESVTNDAFSSTFRDIIFFVIIAFGSGMVVIVLLARQNSKAFFEIESYARFEQKRSAELQNYQLQLEEGMGRLNAVLNNVADAIITIDESGVIQSANPATEEIFGLPLGGIVGRNVSILMPSEMAKRHDGFLKAYAETGRSQIIGSGRELMGKRANGTIFPLELSISEVKLDDKTLYTGILRDITSRKAVEQTLRQSEQKARTLSLVADRTDNAVIITDANARIEWVNGGFERMSGFKLDEIIGLKPNVFLQGENTSPDQLRYMSCKISSGEPFTAEVVNYSKDKTPYWVQIDAQPIYATNGTLERYIAIERDVTDIKQREAELEEAKKRAEQSSLAKSRFLAVISHEMRTPINAINGMLREIRYGTTDPHLLEMAGVALSSSDLLGHLIEDVIDVTRMENDKLTLNRSSFDVAIVADEVVSLLSDRAEAKEISLRLDTQGLVHPLIECDRSRLKQVLINLVSNAIKFTASGSINVVCRSTPTDAEHAQITFEVHDTGKGIDEDDLKKIFERFYQTNIGDGLGLGLAISKDIVDRLGGTISVESRKDFGSTFTISIPVKLTQQPDLEANDQVAGKPLDGLRLLIAEDNSTNQYVVKLIIDRLGGTLAFAGNGSAAVEMAQSDRYDLILMDINMPVMDGVTAFKELKDQTQGNHPPVIALTANALPEQLNSYLREGMAGCVTKPIQEVEFIRIILSVLGRPDTIGIVESPKQRIAPALNARQKSAVDSLLALMDED